MARDSDRSVDRQLVAEASTAASLRHEPTVSEVGRRDGTICCLPAGKNLRTKGRVYGPVQHTRSPLLRIVHSSNASKSSLKSDIEKRECASDFTVPERGPSLPTPQLVDRELTFRD